MNRLRIPITLAKLMVALTIGMAVDPPLPASFYGTVTIAGQNVRAACQSTGLFGAA